MSIYTNTLSVLCWNQHELIFYFFYLLVSN
jgi:hypothetical protein